MEDWKKDWDKMIEAVGTDFREGIVLWGADEVEKGAVRQFLEPLEFDCPLHYDEEVAKEYGYKGIIAPYSSLNTFSMPPLWKPGTVLFESNERNAQPAYSPVTGVKSELLPETSGYLATDLEIDYYEPIDVGDRLCRVGYVLLSCKPKETSIGRGAFMVWESEIKNQDGKLISKIRLGTYSYVPK